jgi:hypothetical protein
MKTEQNQHELSFDELLNFDNFSLEDDRQKNEELQVVIATNQEEEEEEDEPKDLNLPKDSEKDKSKNTTKEIETKISLDNGDSTYLEIIKEKLESGEWEDMLVETEDGTEIKLSELESIDKDTYKTLEKEVKIQQEAEFKEKYISVDGLDEVKKRLISIVKEGDLELAKALFQNPESLQVPFQGYDVDDDSHNEQVLTWYYQNALGHSPKESAALVRAAKEDLSVDVKAQKIVEYQRNQFYNNLKNREKEIIEEKAGEQERIKEYRKTLSAEFKQDGLSENLSKKFVDVATKLNKSGDFEIDTIYDEWMSDPKKAKDLLYFMLDKENYLKKATASTKKDVHLDTLKRIKIIQDTTKVNKQRKEESNPITPFETINFDL